MYFTFKSIEDFIHHAVQHLVKSGVVLAVFLRQLKCVMQSYLQKTIFAQTFKRNGKQERKKNYIAFKKAHAHFLSHVAKTAILVYLQRTTKCTTDILLVWISGHYFCHSGLSDDL